MDERLSVSDLLRMQVPAELLLAVMDHLGVPVFLKDLSGRYVACNPAFERLVGRPASRILGLRAADLAPTELAEIYADRDADLLGSPPGTVQRYRGDVASETGQRRSVEFHKATLRESGVPRGIVGVAVERPIAEAGAGDDLFARSSMLHALFDLIPVGIEVYGPDGRLLEANDATLDMFGVVDPREIAGFDLFSDPNVPDSMKAELREGRSVEYETAFSFEKVKSGNLYKTTRSGESFLAVTIIPSLPVGGGEPRGYLALVRDITAQRLNERRLEYLSFHDSLTGLYNRAYFDAEWERWKLARFQKLGVVMCDVDGLKEANDRFGHEAGDALVKAAAAAMASIFRRGDMVARVGGDEFVAVVPGAGPDTMAAKCARLEKAVADSGEPWPGVGLSVSWGWCAREGEEQTLESVYRRADSAMYEMKRGKGRERAGGRERD